MKEICDLLRKYNLRTSSYKKEGRAVIVNVDDKKYVIKPKCNKEIINYLDNRSFDYYPNIINDKEDDYYIYEYIEGIDIPHPQKVMDMIELVALLHSKTTFYKEVDSEYYERIKEDINNNINYLYGYYTDIITRIESKVFMSPSEYLLARNITNIYKSLYDSKNKLDEWYLLVRTKKRTRQVVLHNNLDLSHFIENKSPYLISWDKSKIDMPIFDLYKLFKRGMNYSFDLVLKKYEENYRLLEEEKMLLYILMGLPDRLEMSESNYLNTLKVNNMLSLLTKENTE